MIWKSKPSLNQAFFIVIAFTAFICMATVGYVWISGEYERFNEDLKELKSDYFRLQKQMLKSEVDTAIDYILFAKSHTEERLKSDIKDRVYEAYAIAMNIYLKNRKIRTDKEIIAMIKDALRPIRFNQGRGYFFAADLTGINQLLVDRPELEGKSMLDFRDTEGKFVVKDMIDLVKKEKEGYYSYTWTKPHSPGQGYPKISFVKQFEPLNWYLGTGEYIEDVEQDIKREVLDRVSNIRFEETGYIFVGQWDGLSLLDPGKGKNMWDVEDVNGVKIVQEIIKAAKAGGGYVEYVLPKFEGYRSTLKVSYAGGINEWQWYVGAGKFMDEIDATVAQKRVKMGENVKEKITKIVLILFGVLVLIILIVRFLSYKIHNNFQVFTKFFSEAVSNTNHVNEDKLNFSEFVNLANSANAMIDVRKKAEEELKESEQRFKNIVQYAQAGYFFIDAKGYYQTVNKAWLDMHKFESMDEVIGRHFSLTQIEEDLELANSVVKSILEGQKLPPGEFSRRNKDGSTGFHTFSISPVVVKGQPVGLEGFIIDNTDRKIAEDKIKVSLAEKETLLQEIHHRVKNNMNVISSLLRLQGLSSEKEEVRQALLESRGRIYAMSAVHETLYNASNLAEIDLVDYLNKLSGALIQSYSVNPEKVQLKIGGDEVNVNIDRASPLGLTINELISNSLKYAFPDDRPGQITINIINRDNELEILVSDNGVGIPESFDWTTSNTLGSKLVRNLIENQLNGCIELDNTKGTHFTIRIPVNDAC